MCEEGLLFCEKLFIWKKSLNYYTNCDIFRSNSAIPLSDQVKQKRWATWTDEVRKHKVGICFDHRIKGMESTEGPALLLHKTLKKIWEAYSVRGNVRFPKPKKIYIAALLYRSCYLKRLPEIEIHSYITEII